MQYWTTKELILIHWLSVKEFSCQKAINFELETGLKFLTL